jgi:hypothetical protein
MRPLSIVLLSCAVLISVASCHKETEQDRVRKVITSIQKASEERDIGKILSQLSKKYNDPQGFTYDTIKGLLLGYFLRHQRISAYMTGLEVSVENSAARAIFQVILTGHAQPGNAAGLLPESLGMYAFDVTLNKESGEWIVVSAKWERMADQGGSGL